MMKKTQEGVRSSSWNQQRSDPEVSAFLDSLEKKLALKMAKVALSSELAEM